MFETKKDVDKHVKTSLAKLRSEAERNLRGHTIAKLYYKIGEYTSALHYVSAYLLVKKDSTQAYKLQGQCYEKLGRIEKALASYQLSIQLKNQQPDLLTDICKLLLSTDLTMIQSKARHWCQLAENLNIQNEHILNLRLKLLQKDNGNPSQVEELIIKEILSRPMDVTLRIRLIRHYLDQNRILDAFKYAYDIEMKQNDVFAQSLDWYNTLSEVVTKFKAKESHLNWSYWLLCTSTLERQLFHMLCLNNFGIPLSNTNVNDCANLLFDFDQTLENFSKNAINVCPEHELAAQFLCHYRGQLCLHAATLIFKRERAQSTHWKEATKAALPLLLLAYNCGTANIEENWLRNSTESRRLVQYWNQHGAFRCSQAGRTLLSYLDSGTSNEMVANIRKICMGKNVWSIPEDLVAQIRQICSNSDWRKIIFKILFKSDHLLKQSTSFLLNCLTLTEPIYDLPVISDLEKYEEIAQWLHPSSLSYMVYLTIETTNIADFKCNVFKGLNFSISNLLNCGAETLNQLDIDSFLYATTIQAKRKFEIQQMNNTEKALMPKFYPYPIVAGDLCTEEQCNWWTSAYKVFKNMSGDEIGEIRTILQNGIEAVRGVSGPKIDLLIALHLGQIFHKRSQESAKAVERGFLEARVEALYKYSLQFIKMWNNRNIEPCPRFFKYAMSQDSEHKTNLLAESAVTFLAVRFFRNEEFEECIDELTNIQLPFATYFQAEAYRKMNESSKTSKKNKRVYIEKALDCLNQTISLLKYPYVDPNHPLKSIVHSDIERLQQISKADNSFMNGSQFLDEYLDTSATSNSRHRRENPNASQAHMVEMENLCYRMMETLSVVKEELTDFKKEIKNEMNIIKTKLSTIEEQVNKKQDDSTVDPNGVLDDYFIMDEEFQNQGYISNSSIYPPFNQQRIHTPNQMIPPILSASTNQQQQTSMNPYGAAAAAAATAPFYNNVYQPIGLNPYQAALISSQRNSLGVVPSQLQYAAAAAAADASIAYSIQQTNTIPDPRNSVLGLLTHQTQLTQSQALPVPVPPTIQTSHQSLTHHQIPSITQQPPPTTIPSQTMIHQQQSQTNLSMDKNIQNNSILRTWNSSFNNAPVEKSPPVNVVITNSDPLPIHTTVTAQPTLSVTIPSHHIKSNTNNSFNERPAGIIFGSTTATETSSNHGLSFGCSATIASADSMFKTKANESDKNVTKKETQTKSLFDGLNLSSSAAQSTPNKSKDENVPLKANPFENFSFTPTAATSTPDKPLTNIFSGLNKGNSNQSTPVNSNVGLLNKLTNDNVQVTKDNANTSKDEDDDYVPTAQFDPVIALPDLIEVKTGEENEIVKFEHRAKLLRYVKESKEWKERGIGNIKILVNIDDPNKARLLMRRDQVLKLCCNQLLTKETQFKGLKKTETALSWYGQDYSENELQTELLAVRFKTADICKQFHNAILEVQANMSGESAVDNPISTKGKSEQKQTKSEKEKLNLVNKSNKDKTVKTTDAKNQNQAEPSVEGFGDKFKPKPGAWTCKACYISNGSEVKYCVACESPKDDTVPKKEPSNTNILGNVATKFNFGIPPPAANLSNNPHSTLTTEPTTKTTASSVTTASTVKGFGDAFKPKAGSWNCKGCYVTNNADVQYCAACEAPKDDTVPKKEQKNIFGTTPTPNKFIFGMPTSNQQFAFGSFTAMNTANVATNLFAPAKTENTSAVTNVPSISSESTKSTVASGGISFTMPTSLDSKESFSFELKPKSPGIKAKSPQKGAIGGAEDVSDDENIEEENNTYFTPVIPLPDKIEVKTGEENEEILYTHRCKLYRFADSEWKERGLGDLKILRHNETGKIRIVMRREQILKICLNHILSDEVEYNVKDDKSWHFVVNDFSEGEVQPMQFCLRFKTKEIAQSFKSAVDDALRISSSDNSKTKENADKATVSNPISEEIKKKSIELQLPIEFFTEKENTCKGCRGCNPDDFIFTERKSIIDYNPLPLTMSVTTPSESNNLIKKSSFVFGGGSDKPNITTKNIFGTINQSQTVTTTSAPQSLFSMSSFATPSKADASSGSIFGNATTKPLIFGGGSNVTSFFGATLPTGTTMTTNPTQFSFNTNNEKKSDDTKSASNFSFENAFAQSTAFGTANSSKSEANKDEVCLDEGKLVTGATNTQTTPSIGSSFKQTPLIFGESGNKPSIITPLFGGEKANSEIKPIFGGQPNKPEESASAENSSFSSIMPSLDIQKSIFGDSNNSTVPLSFGSNTSNISASSDTTVSNSFIQNEKQSESLFKDFGLSFKSVAATQEPTNKNTNVPNEPVLKTDPGLSFASLAQAASTSPNTGFLNTSSNQGFFGLSNKDDFSSFQQPNRNLNGSKGDNSIGDDGTYDPHYDPIIALPDEIVVTTGEEDEKKIFGERAKIFRYDTVGKEWKERGVGELKILYHPEKGRYRLLLRREQVFKCVVNQAITSDLVISAMKASDKAYCWATQNFADESNGEVEKLSARFKNGDIAQRFAKAADECIQHLKSRVGIEPEED